MARLKRSSADRDQPLEQQRLEELRSTARGSDNLLPVIRQALKDRCSIGEESAGDARRLRR